MKNAKNREELVFLLSQQEESIRYEYQYSEFLSEILEFQPNGNVTINQGYIFGQNDIAHNKIESFIRAVQAEALREKK